MMVTTEMARWVANQLRVRIDPRGTRGVNLEQLRQGIEVELEHGDLRRPVTNVLDGDVVKAGRIALAHLRELPDYYTKLATIEPHHGAPRMAGMDAVEIPPGPGMCRDRTPWLPMLDRHGRFVPVCQQDIHKRLRQGWRPVNWHRRVLDHYGLVGRNAVRIGAEVCPGVDVEKWRAANRVPVFRNKMNRWLMVRTTRDNPSADDVRSDLYDAMVRWSGEFIDFWLFSGDGVYVGDFDLVRVVRAQKSDAKGFPPFRLSERLRRAQDLPQGPLPTVNAAGKPLIYFEVSFAYRGFANDLPWPVARVDGAWLTGADKCPTSTDLTLFEVGKPLQDAPPEASLADLLAQTAKRMTQEAAKITFWPALLAVSLIGIVAWGRKQVGV